MTPGQLELGVVAHQPPAAPTLAGPFAVNLMDPPWPEFGGGKIKRGADRHYALIRRKEDIRDVILGSGLWNPADDAHLYMWVTNNYLPWGLWLICELGFEYKTTIVWVKTAKWTVNPLAALKELKRLAALVVAGQVLEAFRSLIRTGIGQYFRGEHELLLFATRGSGYAVKTDRRDLGTVIVAPLGRHSAKPEESYELIEARSTGARVEFFCRTPRDGWSAFGNELDGDGDA